MSTQAVVAQLAYITLLLACILVAARAQMTARSRFFLLACGLVAAVVPIAQLAKLLIQVPIVIPPLLGAAMFTPDNVAVARTFSVREALTIIGFAVPLALITISLARTAAFRRRVLSAAVPPSARENNALASVSTRRRPSLLRSRAVDTAILVGILRPAIVLPEAGCDRIGDEELRSLLAHECAHAVRGDNAFGIIERLIAAIYWFHPLIWILRRELALAREQACDEMAADCSGSDNVVSAITLMTRSFASAPGASCAASSNLKERIDHIMSYDSLRRSALPHRAVALLGFVLAAIVATAVAASTSDRAGKSSRYILTYSLARNSAGAYDFNAKIIDGRNAAVIASPKLTFVESASTEGVDGATSWRIDVAAKDGKGAATVRVTTGGDEETFTQPVAVAAPKSSKYAGEPISLNLRDADLRDVLGMFAKLTKIQFVIDPDIQGKVTIAVHDTPWDEALDRIITENGYKWTLEGGKMHIHS